ncbi:MAG: type II secretion system protein [Synechococcaceae cyanobacterium]|nr:type II secretion system protein [Synechococcaceae cyanobacterium]
MTNEVKTPVSSRGFSLIELTIAISFFGILMLGFLMTFPLGYRTVQKSEMLTVATSHAQDEIERLKTLPFNDPDLAPGTHFDAENPIDGIYNRVWTVTENTPVDGLTTVAMGITYSDNGIPRNIQITTYLAR